MEITMDKAITHLWAAAYGATLALLAAQEVCKTEFQHVPGLINHLQSGALLSAILVFPIIYYWRRDKQRRQTANPQG